MFSLHRLDGSQQVQVQGFNRVQGHISTTFAVSSLINNSMIYRVRRNFVMLSDLQLLEALRDVKLTASNSHSHHY